MTTVEHIPTTVLDQGERVTPVSAVKPVDRTFNPNETCAPCGPSTRAQFRCVTDGQQVHSRAQRPLPVRSLLLCVSVGCSSPASSTWLALMTGTRYPAVTMAPAVITRSAARKVSC
jgi:hypothetical protein